MSLKGKEKRRNKRIPRRVLTYPIFAILVATFYTYSCGRPSGTGLSTDALSSDPQPVYSWLNTNVFQARCISCHSTAVANAGIDLSSYSRILATGSVNPGNPNGSSMYVATLSGTMPKTPPALSSAEVQAIFNWIQNGAVNDLISTPAVVVPTVSNILPASGTSAGGTSVTIVGTNFVSGASVTIGGTACANLVVSSSTIISCVTPAHAAGAVDVVVTNPNTQAGTLSGGFTFNPILFPILSSVSPTSGTADGGTSITITGSNFVSGASITIGGTACTSAVVSSSTAITCITPAHVAATVDIVVTNPDTHAGALSSGFTFTPAPFPTLSSVSPTSGTAGGGTGVTLVGTNFVSGANVTFGGTSCTGTVVSSSTTITCITPAHAAATVDIVVTNPDTHAGTLSGGFVFNPVIVPAPTVSSVSPTSGATSGGTFLTVNGSNFSSGALVSLGSSACNGVTVVSSSQITCTTSSGSAGATAVQVTNSDFQAGSLSSGFTYLAPAPVVSSVSPTSGTASGGTSLTVNGSNFSNGATVSLGSSACNGAVVVSSSQITCTTTSGAVGAVTVQVTNSDLQVGSLNSGFTYVVGPTFSSINSNIIQTKCISCHGSPPSSGYNFSSYSALLSAGVVSPGNAAGSQFYIQVNAGLMPQGGPPLSSTEIQAIQDWINNGAQNN